MIKRVQSFFSGIYKKKIIIAGVFLFFSAGVLNAINVYAEDWPKFRGNLQNTGYYSCQMGDALGLLWNYQTGGSVDHSASIADGKVFIGSADGKLYALNEETGEFIWSYQTGSDIYSSPAVSDNKVFFGSNDKKLYALNEETGEFIWSYQTGSQVYSSPAVSDNKVFFGSNDKKLYALNEETGRLIWSYETDSGIWSSPAVSNGKIFIVSSRNMLYALDEETGEFIWRHQTGGDGRCAPAISDGKVFISGCALDEETGELIWKYNKNCEGSSSAIAYGKVFFCAGAKVYALDEETGSLLWCYGSADACFLRSSPAVADGKVFVGDSYGEKKLHALDAETGEFIWSSNEPVSGGWWASAAIANGKVFVGSDNGNFYAFDFMISDVQVSVYTTLGKISWQTEVPTTTRIEYGTTLDYGNIIEDNILAAEHQVKIERLEPDTKYYLKIHSFTAEKEYIYTGYFITINPIVSIEISSHHIRVGINYQTVEPTTARIEYGITTGYGTVEEDLNLDTQHHIELYGLEPDTNYYFKIHSFTAENEEYTYTGDFATINNPPVLNPIGNKETDQEELLEFTIFATDPNGDLLTYSAANLPEGAAFSPETRTFSWTPTRIQAGRYAVSFRVKDEYDGSDSETINIQVTGVPLDIIVSPADIEFYSNFCRVIVHASGDFPLTDVKIALYDGDPQGNPDNEKKIGEKVISQIAPGVLAEVNFDLSSLFLYKHKLFAWVDTYNEIEEFNEENNIISKMFPAQRNIVAIDTEGNVGAYTSLAIDSGDSPRISYYDGSNRSLKYAAWDGSLWSVETVDSDSEGNAGRYTSLKLDSMGRPHISYYYFMPPEGFGYSAVKYAVWNGNSWDIEDVDRGIPPYTKYMGRYTSLALDSTGNPHISYNYSMSAPGPCAGSALEYAGWNGSSWDTTTIDSGGYDPRGPYPRVGEYTSLALDTVGYPRISYYDNVGEEKGLKYAALVNGIWNKAIVDQAEGEVAYTSLVLDPITDRPRISYYNDGKLKYAAWNGDYWDDWEIEVVDDSAANVGLFTSLALDANGNPHISYYDATSGDLKYAVKENGIWDIEIIDTVGDVGKYTSLALDSEGNPWISYYDATNGNLKLVLPGMLSMFSLDWPMFRHNPQHTGYSHCEVADELVLMWSYQTGGDIRSAPSIADGKVFVGSYDSKLYALDEETGEFIWSYQAGGAVRSSPAIADGKVFVGSYDGKLYALDEETGEFIWSYQTGGEINHPSPNIANGKVFIGSRDNKFYALDEETGEFIWSYQTGGEIFSSPAIADGKVFVGSYDGKLYALDEETGELIWSYQTGGAVMASPAIADNKVFFGSWDNNLYALDENTGVVVWNIQMSQTGELIHSSPAVTYGKVFFGSDRGIHALDEETGELIWSSCSGNWVESSPAIADGKVFICLGDGNLCVLDAETGELIWSYEVGGNIDSSPTIANGKVFIGSCDSKLYVFGSAHNNLIIDGDFDDWNNIKPIGTDNAGDISSGDVIDWTRLWALSENEKLYLSYETVSDIDFSSNGWWYAVYIDADNNPSTGYKGLDGSFLIGAEYSIEAGALHQYTGSGCDWNWNFEGFLNYAYTDNRLEMKIPESSIGVSEGYTIRIMLLGNNPAKKDFANDDKSGFVYSSGMNIVDNEAPANCSIKINNDVAYTNSTLVTLTLSAADVGSGMGSGARMQFSNDNVKWSTPDDYALTKSWTLTSGDGTKTVYAKFKDVAGNWSDAVFDTIIIDTTLPSVPVVTDDGDYTASAAQFHSTWSSNDSESGIVEYQYAMYSSINGKTYSQIKPWTSATTSITATPSIIPLIGDTIYFAVKAKNGAGLWSVEGWSDGIKIDTTPPVKPTFSSNAYTTSLTQMAAIWTSSDAESGIAEYQYAIGTKSGLTDITGKWISTGTTASAIATSLKLTQGATYYFSVKAKNGAGTWSAVGTYPIKVDTSIPTSAPVVTDDGAYTTSATQLHVSWTQPCKDNESGIAKYEYGITKDSASGTVIQDWTSNAMVNSVTNDFSSAPLSNGIKYYFSVRAVNGAGLTSAVGSSDGIKVDTTLPTTPTVSDDGAYTANAKQLHAAWSASDSESGIAEYQYAIGTSKGAADIVTWTNTTAASVTKTGLSLQCGKTYYFTVHAKNGAGLWNGPAYSDGITVDNASPIGTIKINGDDTYASSTSVTLTLSATDAGSGMGSGSLMMFSNDGSRWSSAEAYVTTKSWTLTTGDGTKTVYAKFKDVAGNWTTASITDAIILDTTAPAITHTPIAQAPKNKPITFKATITDSTSGVKEATLYWRKWIFSWLGWKWSDPRSESMNLQGSVYAVTLTASQVEDRKIKYYIKAIDKAGIAKSTSEYVITRY